MIQHKPLSIFFLLTLSLFLTSCDSELIVHNGEGSGKYKTGNSVTIKANPAEGGYRFFQWEGDVSGVEETFSAETIIRILRSKVEVSATYSPLDELYHLSVVRGKGSGDYAPGASVNVEANAPGTGLEFDKWIGDVGVLNDVEEAKQDLHMPQKDIVITATYTGAVDDTIQYRLEKVFTGPSDTYKLVGMLGTSHGLFVTLCNVYRGSNRSRIYLDGKLIYKGSQETIGQPFEWNGKVIFPVEHGSNVLIYKNGKIINGAKTSGRWSVAGFVHEGRPLLPYNNNYNGAFGDIPDLHDAITGKFVFSLNAKSMPRKFVHYKNDVWASLNFGEHVLINKSGWKMASDAVHIEVYQGTLYGGGGSAWGPTANPAQANGRIYRFTGSKWKELMDTGGTSVQHMAVLNGRMWMASPDPDRLHVMDPDGRISKVAEILGETANNKARSFGASVAYHKGHIYWGRSDNKLGHVYKLVPK